MNKPPIQPPAFLDTDVARYLMDTLRTTIPVYDHDTEAEKQARRDSAVAAMVAMRPRDATEGMLASQAIAARHAADDCYHRARLPGTSPKMAKSLCRLAASLTREVAARVSMLEAQQSRPFAAGPKISVQAQDLGREPTTKCRDNAMPPAVPLTRAKSTAGRHPEYGYLH